MLRVLLKITFDTFVTCATFVSTAKHFIPAEKFKRSINDCFWAILLVLA